MKPRAMAEGLWVIDAPLRTRGLQLGARTTLARLEHGGLFVHSPGPVSMDSGVLDAVRALGDVRALVAPNALHHLFLAAWAEAFPQAACFGAPGVAAKQPALRIEPLTGEAPALWRGQIEQTPLAGMPALNEFAWRHRASRSLLLTDLCFNLRRAPLLTRLAMRLNSAWDRFGPSRLCRSMIRDPAALRGSLECVLGWDFERIVVAHGDVLEPGGPAQLREAFSWLLDG